MVYFGGSYLTSFGLFSGIYSFFISIESLDPEDYLVYLIAVLGLSYNHLFSISSLNYLFFFLFNKKVLYLIT